MKESISDTPLVTIGVASYNNEKYIEETLKSIANQTYQNIEIIIVDDCSKDNSVNIINSFIAKNTQVKCYFFPLTENKGIPAVCNLMLNNAHGNYLSIFSSDDIMKENKIEVLVKELKASNEQIAGLFSIAEVIDENGNKKSEPLLPYKKVNDETKESLFKELAEKNIINTLTTLLKTDIVKKVGGFNEKYCYEDHDLWMRLLYNYEIKFVPIITVEYRRHDNQITSSKFSKRVTIDKYKLLCFHRNKSNKYKKEFKEGLRRCLRGHVKTKGIDLKVIGQFLNYIFYYSDYKGVGLLFYYLIKKK